MRRIIALLLAMTLVATGCSGKGDKDEPKLAAVDTAINVQLGGEPDTLDPAFAVTPADESYIIHLFEGLTTLSDTLEAAPGVAKSWEMKKSETGLVSYTFTLDDKAKWSDGQQVTAEDFIYSWTRTLDPATNSPVAYKLYPIRGAQAFNMGTAAKAESSSSSESSSSQASSSSSQASSSSGSSTDGEQDNKAYVDPNGLGLSIGSNGELIITLEGDCPDLLTRVASAAWMPLRESVVKANPDKWSYDAKKYLSNGPYVLSKWERDQSISMDRSKNYRDAGSVKAPNLNFVLSEDSELLLGALRDGTVQYATSIPQLELEAAGDALRQNVQLGSYTLVFNTRESPFDNPKVRQALSLAIDRTALAAAMRDNSVPATGLVPPGAVVDGVDLRKKGGDLVATTANMDKAAKLLDEAGYKGGKSFPGITYIASDLPVHQRMAENIAAAWEQLGITTQVVTKQWDEYVSSREESKFDVTHLSIFSDNLYPSVFLDSWLSDSTSNFAGYNSNVYDGLIDLSYGREPRKGEEPKTEAAEGDEKKEDAAKTDDKKTDDKKTEDKKTEEKKTEETKTDDKTEDDKPEEETKKSVADCLTEAEKLLVQQDAAIVPISWYTGAYLTGTGTLDGFKIYPTSSVYFGGASYTAPKEDSK